MIELTGRESRINGEKVYQIRAATPIHILGLDIPQGTVGGWISDLNLIHYPNVWVDEFSHLVGTVHLMNKPTILLVKSEIRMGHLFLGDKCHMISSFLIGGKITVRDEIILYKSLMEVSNNIDATSINIRYGRVLGQKHKYHRLLIDGDEGNPTNLRVEDLEAETVTLINSHIQAKEMSTYAVIDIICSTIEGRAIELQIPKIANTVLRSKIITVASYKHLTEANIEADVFVLLGNSSILQSKLKAKTIELRGDSHISISHITGDNVTLLGACFISHSRLLNSVQLQDFIEIRGINTKEKITLSGILKKEAIV